MRIDWIVAVALTPVAFAGTLSGTPAAAQSRRAPQTEIRYAEMDRDHDGVITRSEWQGTRRAFDAADWNHDGVLSGDEVRLDERNTPAQADSATRRACSRSWSSAVPPTARSPSLNALERENTCRSC